MPPAAKEGDEVNSREMRGFHKNVDYVKGGGVGNSLLD